MIVRPEQYLHIWLVFLLSNFHSQLKGRIFTYEGAKMCQHNKKYNQGPHEDAFLMVRDVQLMQHCSLSNKPWQDSGGGFKVAQYFLGLECVVIGRGFNITCIVHQMYS